MKFTISKEAPENFKCDIFAIACHESAAAEGGEKKPAQLRREDTGFVFDKALGGAISAQITTEKFTGEHGTTRLLFTGGRLPARFVLLIGLGPRSGFGLELLREATAAIARTARGIKASSVALVLEHGKVSDLTAAARAGAIAEGIQSGNYKFCKYKTSSSDKAGALSAVTFLYKGEAAPILEAIETARINADAEELCRNMVNTPALDAKPSDLVKTAKSIALQFGLSFHQMSMNEIRKEKMNGLLAIGKGSTEPPAFVALEYKPKGRPKAHIALVGKGVTFDSGGISLKPPRSMETMKDDMAGAAVVLSAMRAIARLKPKAKVSAYIPLAENMPDGRAIKPGDIYTARNGKTVEIVSTDAEGRLLLADALSYASDKKPDVIVDLATLTGGAVYCCGELYSLVMGNDQKVVDKLLRASKEAGEHMWQLPIVESYRKGYTSGIADLNNVGRGKAQTILGAIFLEEFIGKIPWAHIDIGANAWSEEDSPLIPKGATGAATKTIIKFVCGY